MSLKNENTKLLLTSKATYAIQIAFALALMGSFEDVLRSEFNADINLRLFNQIFCKKIEAHKRYCESLHHSKILYRRPWKDGGWVCCLIVKIRNFTFRRIIPFINMKGKFFLLQAAISLISNPALLHRSKTILHETVIPTP
jgi:hypothetical protein